MLYNNIKKWRIKRENSKSAKTITTNHQSLIRIAIQKSKSKQRFLRLNEVRDELKRSKERSHSFSNNNCAIHIQSKSHSAQRILKLNHQQQTPHSIHTVKVKPKLSTNHIQQSSHPATAVKNTHQLQPNKQSPQIQSANDKLGDISQIIKENHQMKKQLLDDSGIEQVVSSLCRKRIHENILELIGMESNQARKIIKEKEKLKKYQKYLCKLPCDFFTNL